MTKSKKVFLAVAFTASVLFATNVADVKAAELDVNPKADVQTVDYAAPTGQTTITAQTDYSDSYVKFSYSYVGVDARSFDVFVSMDPNVFDFNTPYSGTAYADAGQAYVYGLQAGTTYYVALRPYNGYGTSKVYGAVSNVFEVVTCPNVKPEITYYGSPSTTSMQVNWNPVPGANGYVVSYYDSNVGSSAAVTTQTADCGIVIGKLTANKIYTVIVYPYHANSAGQIAVLSSGTYVYSIPLKPSKCSAPEISSYSRTSGYFYANTSQRYTATGYQYDVYTANKTKDTRVKTFSGDKYSYINNKLSNSAFKKAALYKVRVRAYSCDSNGTKQYGEWSNWTYMGAQSRPSYKNTSSGITVKWDKLSGASRYVVSISTSRTSGYKRFTTTTKNSVKITKCGSSKLKKKTTYYITIVAQKKVSGKYVNVAEPYCYSTYYTY